MVKYNRFTVTASPGNLTMNRGRRNVVAPAGLTGSSPEQQTSRPRPNRLSRSFRQSQAAESPVSQKSEFKTPTRIPRSRFSEESPHNESDFQQDIIWDAASPSPNRLGKRGKKHPARGVNISEIVSRIAPKHGRPEVPEPTLQQWIGDSAAIPCTPDVQAPKPKRKSPRTNAVDDLLKLAKQFDFSMFHQCEAEVEDAHQQSPQLLSEDTRDLKKDDHNDVSPWLPGNCRPAMNAAAGTDAQARVVQQMEDDLDFLFDGPTQHVSRNLSQLSSAQPSQVQPAHGSASGVSTTNTNTSVSDEFEDDWENDDLLNESLLLDMTQNPQMFAAPKNSSAQKPASGIKHPPPVRGGAAGRQPTVSQVGKENVGQRSTFKLESNLDFSVKRSQTWANLKVGYSSKAADKDAQQSRFSSTGEVGPQHTWRTCQSNPARSHPQKSQFYQRTSATSSLPAASASDTPATETGQKHDVSSHQAVYDFQDEDLDSFFSSDLVWDDPADDNLLCEIFDDLENQIQSLGNVSIRQTPPVGPVPEQRAALQPSNRTWDSGNQQPASGRAATFTHRPPQKQTPTTLPSASGRPGSLAAGVQVNTVRDSLRFTQRRTVPGSTCLQGSSRVQSAAAAPQPTSRDQFTFKRPNNLVVGDKGKCSAAEIELKKQQAKERRQQRLLATHNLRAPT
uniref:ETAA1 activator of ATR kinase n=1 Tax=Monopterus albus TaxID=43700 RepID=A0A3Q3J8Y9_MONAL|nr:uncharacterized protein LOC109971759 isoform X2 [Monopterus albus]XP_020475867.1 uncharacterized protein LOC109971759 isoform X3 [Monopterus albus]